MNVFEEAALPERVGSVYKMWHASDPHTIYVGSTKTSLTNRLSKHKTKAKQRPDRKVYKYLNSKGISNTRIELLEHVVFQTALQLRIAEDKWIRELSPSLNSVNAILDEENKKKNMKKYYEEHKDIKSIKDKQRYEQKKPEILAQKKEYCKKNKEKVAEMRRMYRVNNANKYTCDICHFHSALKNDFTRHQNSQRHRGKVAAQAEQAEQEDTTEEQLVIESPVEDRVEQTTDE